MCPPSQLNDLYEGTVGRLKQFDLGTATEVVSIIASIRRGLTTDQARDAIKANMPESEIHTTFDEIIDWIRETAEKLRCHSGITCFSQIRGDQRMWATYGDNHSGVCIEFANRTGASEIHKRAQPVLYSSEALSHVMPQLIRDDLTLDIYRLALWCYFVKSEDWRDEHEWRVFMIATDEVAPQDRFLPFDIRDVRRVFCGPRMTASQRETLENIRDKHGKHWAIFDLRPNVHEGVSEFDGVDVLDGKKDFAYWFPELFNNAKTERPNKAVNPSGGSCGF